MSKTSQQDQKPTPISQNVKIEKTDNKLFKETPYHLGKDSQNNSVIIMNLYGETVYRNLGNNHFKSVHLHQQKNLQHKNLLPLQGYKIKPDNQTCELYYPYQKGTRTLASFIPSDLNKGKDSSKKIFETFLQIIAAIDFLHSKGSIHGNLNENTVLIHPDEGVKILGYDLGYEAIEIAEIENKIKNEISFIAPEKFESNIFLIKRSSCHSRVRYLVSWRNLIPTFT